MKKRLLTLFSLVSLITLNGCNNGSDNSSNNISNSNSNTTSTNSSANIVEGNYRVKVLLPDGTSAGEGIMVQWCAGGLCKSSYTNSDGIAAYELEEGTYDVKVSNYPSQYACQLGFVATAENKELEVRLQTILAPSLKTEEVVGDDSTIAGSPYNPYIVQEGVYNVTVKSEGDIQFFGFVPNRPGKYIIESWGTSTSLITSDPSVNYYGNNPQYINEILKSDDDSGYAVNEDLGVINFSLELDIPIEEFLNKGEIDEDGNMIYEKDEKGNYVSGGIYTFGISATPIKSAKTFPFVVKWVDEYVVERVKADVVDVQETLSQYPEKPAEYVWLDSKLNGLDTVVYNEEDGFYHVGTKDGYVLTAKISATCEPYLDRPFSKVTVDESGAEKNEGIVGLTGIVLANGTKDYTSFVQEYEKYCNSDGVYGVTEELKTFLELYFQNSKDWIISVSEKVVDESSGWMFACGYYVDVKDSYAKPWSGLGDETEPYTINAGEQYYADVQANSSVYYSYYLKNTMNEVILYIKSTNSNAKFVYGTNEYSSETGAYLEVNLGGNYSSGLVFSVTTVDGEAEGIVFEIGIKEKTVAGDAIALGDNTIEVAKGSNVDCSFTAPRDGTYTITSSEGNAWFRYNGSNYKGTDGEISFSAELKKGDVLEFKLLTCDLEFDYITFTLSCDAYLEEDLNMIEIKAWEVAEYIFLAKEAGTYEFECGTDNTKIGIEDKYGCEWIYDKYTVELEANEEFKLLIATDDNNADTAIVIISKI